MVKTSVDSGQFDAFGTVVSTLGDGELKIDSDESGYREVFEVAKILHRTTRTVTSWIRRFKLGPDQGVLHPPGGYLIHWPTFEREFVRQMDRFIDGNGKPTAVDQPEKAFFGAIAFDDAVRLGRK